MLIIIIIVNTILYSVYGLECDQTFKSDTPGASKRGTFHSPMFPETYPSNVRCVYKFIGRKDEKVTIKFKYFYIEGLLAKCKKDFLDVYIEIESESTSLANSIALGRFCGRKLAYVPNTIVSLKNIVALDFYAAKNTQTSYNQDGHMGQLGFNGTFQFSSNAPYFPGSPQTIDNRGCNFIINSENHNEGKIHSPTFPGIYPSNINCTYLLLGRPNERIRLLFSILDLNEQNDVCIDDYVLVYDGKDESSPVIGDRFCGRHRNLKLVSTGYNLLIRFVTGSSARRVVNNEDSVTLQRSGFSLFFHFGTQYIYLDNFMRKYHIRGTECDLLIKSTGKSQGELASPGHPHMRVPINKTCTYFLIGLHNRQRMETALLRFTSIDIPNSTDNKCSKGSLAIYSVNYTPRKIELRPKPLPFPSNPCHKICGTSVKLIPSIRCEGPLVLLRLNTTNSFTAGIGGFRLKYVFQSDYGIPGYMPYDDRCYFIYNITTSSNYSGYTNSPFLGRHYPPNITCQYDFIPPQNHQIHIYFQSFSLSNANSKRPPYHSLLNKTCKGRDKIQVYEYFRGQSHSSSGTLIQELCGKSVPGPILTQPGSTKLRLIFQSVTSKSDEGFMLNYHFYNYFRITKHRCGSDIMSQKGGGIILSHNYPLNYPNDVFCQWKIKTNSKSSKIMIRFHDFVVEEYSQSCRNTILRVYDGNNLKASSELCGTDSSIPAYISTGNEVTLKFLTSPFTYGQKGFKLVWTELLTLNEYGICSGFVCENTKRCINTELECDGVSHCGTYLKTDEGILKSVTDDSDEIRNCPVASSYNLLHIGLGIIVTMFVLILLVVYVLYKEHRKQHIKSISSTSNNNTMNTNMNSATNPMIIPSTEVASIPNHTPNMPDHTKPLLNHVSSSPALPQPSLDHNDSLHHHHQHHFQHHQQTPTPHHHHQHHHHSTTSSSSRPNSTQSHHNNQQHLSRNFSVSRETVQQPLQQSTQSKEAPLILDFHPKTPSLTSLRRAQSTRNIRYPTTPCTHSGGGGGYSNTCHHSSGTGYHTPHHYGTTGGHGRHGGGHHGHSHGHGTGGGHHGHGHHHHHHHHHSRSLSRSLSKSHNCNLNSNNYNRDHNFDLLPQNHHSHHHYNNNNNNNNNNNFYTIPKNNHLQDDGAIWTREKMQKISIV